MKTNEKNISLKEALQINHRAYKIFYRYYPKLIPRLSAGLLYTSLVNEAR